MKRLLFALMVILPIYAEAKQGIVKLVKVSSEENGVLKEYTAKDSLLVEYFYFEDLVEVSEHTYGLFFKVVDDKSVLNPVEINKGSFVVGGDSDVNVRKLGIPSGSLKSGCVYSGRATVKLSDIQVWKTEFPGESYYSAKIDSIISSTAPRFKCEIFLPTL